MNKIMSNSRRNFLKKSLISGAGLGLAGKGSLGFPAVIADMNRPNSLINGVQLGTITYSYRSMPDQSAEGLLGYILDSGISAVEIMGDPVEAFAGIPADPNPDYADLRRRQLRGQLNTQEENYLASIVPSQEAYFEELADWRANVPMSRFEELRRMYEDAGVAIYAWKPSVFDVNNTDAEIDYAFRVAKALGASHCTAELPADSRMTARFGEIAARNQVYIAYHTHEQGSMTVFDEAFAQSDYNASNIDLGHYVAAPNGGDPLPFLRRHHGRTLSAHLKDRQTLENGAGNLMWGTGDTPLVEILQLMRDENYDFAATVELEYQIPEGSDAVNEVARCVEFCRRALEA